MDSLPKSAATEEPPIAPRPASLVELPLSNVQQRVYYLCTSYPGESSPFIHLSWRMRGPLDLDAWARANATVVDRHEGLRTVFVPKGTSAVQVVLPPTGLETKIIDLRELPEDQRETRAREILMGKTKLLLDMEHGPLVESCVLRLGEDDQVWCLAMHHLLADGSSLNIISRELRACYNAYLVGAEPDLADLPVQYGDYSVWQQEGFGAGGEEALKYWLRRLDAVPVLELPTDMPRPEEKNTRGADVSYGVDNALAERLEALAHEEHCTLFMVMLAAFQALLAIRSGQYDFCVGTPIAGRTRVELEPVVGLFASTLPLRCDLGGNPTFREILARAWDTSTDALDRQDVPFNRVVTELGLPDDKSRTQVFQVIFVMHTEYSGDPEPLPGITISPFPIGMPGMIHDLIFQLWRGPQGIATDFRYDSALFTHETVLGLAKRYERMLRVIVDNPDVRLLELALRSGGAK